MMRVGLGWPWGCLDLMIDVHFEVLNTTLCTGTLNTVSSCLDLAVTYIFSAML